MQTPMSEKFRKFLSNPSNASKLSEKILRASTKKGESISVEVEGTEIHLRQIGYPNKDKDGNTKKD